MAIVLSYSRIELNSGDFISYRANTENLAKGNIYSEIFSNIYFAKEFLFWGLLALITKVFSSFNYAIYLLDIICITLFFISFSKYRTKLPFEILLFSFIILMGFTNTYRQTYALSIFLCGLNLWILDRNRAATVTLVIATLFHNVFLGFGLLLLIANVVKDHRFYPLIIAILIFFSLYINSITTQVTNGMIAMNGVESGIDSRWIIALMLLTISICYYSIKGKISKLDRYYFIIFTLSFFILIFSNFIIESSAERLLQLSLIICSYLTIYKLSMTRSSKYSFGILVVVFIFTLVIPSVLSDSSSNLIFPTNAS
jgi:hypothetical protein